MVDELVWAFRWVFGVPCAVLLFGLLAIVTIILR